MQQMIVEPKTVCLLEFALSCKRLKNCFPSFVCTGFEILKHKKQQDQCKDFTVYFQNINNSKEQNESKSQDGLGF